MFIVSLRAEGEAIYTKLAVFSVARFGTWVVCIYRTWAMQSLSVINCSDLRPFLFLGRKRQSNCQIMLGGLEFLYNNIIENTTSKEDVFNNIYGLIETYLIAYPDTEAAKR